VLEIPPDIGLH